MEIYKLEQKNELEFTPISQDGLMTRFHLTDKSWWILSSSYLGQSKKMVCYDSGDVTIIHDNMISESITYLDMMKRYEFGRWDYIRCDSKMEMLTEFAKSIEEKGLDHE